MYKHIAIGKKINKYIRLGVISLIITYLFFPLSFPVFASLPTSSNFKLQEYGFGSGGTSNSTSTSFKLNGIAGEVEFGRPSSTNFKAGSGLTYMMQANVPPAPTLTNPSNYYNKLQIQLNTGNNASDTQFAIAVQNSSDSYATTKYVQADDTLGSSPVWQTNTAWGISGFTIIGLTPGLTYRASIAAKQGNFTQSTFGPTAQVATVTPTFSMSLSSNALAFPQLDPGTVKITTSNVTISISTNGTSGATVYTYDSNNGLHSTNVNYTISAVSSDLAGATEGYGLQATSVSQTSGGPMEELSPYNGTGNVVGLLDSNKRIIFDSSGAPVTGGNGVFNLQAKSSNTTKAAADYQDVITVIGSATF
jgi:hypothetical protein